jgi:hypothetical protein
LCSYAGRHEYSGPNAMVYAVAIAISAEIGVVAALLLRFAM